MCSLPLSVANQQAKIFLVKDLEAGVVALTSGDLELSLVGWQLITLPRTLCQLVQASTKSKLYNSVLEYLVQQVTLSATSLITHSSKLHFSCI
jgi:hypothetical protein